MAHHVAAAAAKRNVDIIPQPASQAHVPALPQPGKAGSLERAVKVFQQVIPQNAGSTDGDIATAGKIQVEPQAEQQGGGHQVGTIHLSGGIVHHLDVQVHIVRQDHLFGVAPQHAERTARTPGVAEPAGFVDLWPKMGVPLNGAGGHGGKKADEQRIMQRVQLNLAAALVYINGVAERSKGKVAQAQRGNHIRAGLQYRAAQDICRQQVPVFVIEQKPHTGEHRQKQENHPHGTYPAFADHQPAAPCDQCCRNQNRYQQAVVGPPAVKQVAGSQQTVRAQNTGQGIVQKRHCRKKAKK